MLGHELYAQEYPVRTYTIRDGLSQMQVQAVFRDSRGYLWVGTKYGFCKYNGEGFEQFSPKQSVIGYDVTGFDEDSKRNIYTNSQVGITKYNGKTFTRLRTGVPEHNSIQSFTIDKQNQIYTISNEGKLHTFIKDSLVALNWPSLKNKQVKNLTYDKTSHQLLGFIDSLGLVYLTPKRLILIAPPQIYPPDYLSASLTTARNGQKVLIISQKDNSNLYYMHTPSAGWQAFLSVNDKQVTVLKTVDFDWFFNFQQKTYLLEANTKQTHQISSIAFDEMSGKALAYTPNGTWMATEKGLVFVSQNGFRYFSEQEVSTTWSVVEDAQQRIWTLNWDKPIRRFDGQKFETVTGYREVLKKRISQVNDNGGAMGDSWYYQPIKDKFGHLWFAHTMGVMQYDGKRFEFLIPPKTKSPIAMSLLEDPSHNLIIQGGQEAVYFWENKPPFRVTNLTAKDGFNISPYVLCSTLEKSGVYWFGSSKIIIRYDYDRKQFKEYSREKGNWDGRNCVSILFDNRGTLWVGSRPRGLFYLDANADSLVLAPHLFLNDFISSITQLDADHLLIGGNKDLYVMDLKAWYASKKVVLKCYNHNNGFIGLEPNQNSFFKDSKGRVWIPSSTVLSVVDPKKLDLSPGQVSTYFTRLNGERIGFTHAQQDSIHALPHGTGNVRLEFESVGDDKPFNSQYSYYIEGITKDWTAWQSEPVITLSHLASGIYTVRVKARTGSTEAKSNEAVLRFKVSVYPWQSPYFPYYASGLLLAVLAGAGYLYWQSQLRQREVRKQQKLIKEQETTAERQGQMVKTLQVQTAQAQMNPHFTFNVLNTLQALIFRQETEKANENIVNLSKLMRSYLNASISSDGTAASLEQGLITLDHEIELLRMYLGFEEVAYRDRFKVDINIHPALKLDFYRIPPLLIQPFVENAIKHGVLPNENQFGHIWVRFWLDADETLVCEVEDDGIGREQSRIRKENAIQTYTSEGTNLVKQRVELLNQLGYQIHIETLDREGGGTHVIIRMFDQLI